MVGMLLVSGEVLWAQQTQAASAAPNDSLAAAVHELQEQVKELREAVTEVRGEAAQYRAETAELRRELQVTREQLAGAKQPAAPSPANATPAPTSGLEERVAALEESTQLLNGKVDDQYQSKVESASKYRVRLSGIVLLNAFSNRGKTDNLDFPAWADPPTPLDPNGAFGATLRQSELGLEAFGPRVAGARTSGNLQLDFSGGFPSTFNGANFGIARLRIASMRLDWDHTSIVAGQDSLFLSPNSPTSFATLAIPSLAYAGNLWGWIPQVRVEHRFDLSPDQNITVQGGILDNVVGEMPYTTFDRQPQAGERSGQPAYGARVAWTHNVFGLPLTLGSGGYYSRQDWGFNRHVDGWAGMADWQAPLFSRLTLSGEFYRGRAAGGLGGAIGRSVLFNGDPTVATTQLQPLDSIGGWSQLKFQATSKLELNGAYGIDSPFAQDVRTFSSKQNYFGSLVQNRVVLGNFVYRPRSNLLFSSEYRHLRTNAIDAGYWTADQVSLSMGILF